MNRKNFLKSFAFTAMGSSVLLAACGNETKPVEQKNTEAQPEAAPVQAEGNSTADCTDLSGVAEADLKQRESLSYVVKSDDPEKNCANCRFYQPGSQPNGCGGCQLFKGPVTPEGNCKSWFKKDA